MPPGLFDPGRGRFARVASVSPHSSEEWPLRNWTKYLLHKWTWNVTVLSHCADAWRLFSIAGCSSLCPVIDAIVQPYRIYTSTETIYIGQILKNIYIEYIQTYIDGQTRGVIKISFIIIITLISIDRSIDRLLIWHWDNSSRYQKIQNR